MATSTIKQVTSTSGSGYCKMLDGTLIQWGMVGQITFSSEAMKEGSFMLPISFVDAGYRVLGTAVSTSINSYLLRVGASPLNNREVSYAIGSGTGEAISANNRGFTWIAVGRWK